MKFDRSKTMPYMPTPEMVEAAYPLLDMRDDTPARRRRKVTAIYQEMFALYDDKPSPALTKNQAKVHHFIAEHISTKQLSPTLDEISAACGFSTRTQAFDVVEALERKGFIKRVRRGAARSIAITVRPGRSVTRKYKQTRKRVLHAGGKP